MTEQQTTKAVATRERTAKNSVIVRMAERFQMDPVAFERVIRETCMPAGKNGPVSTEQLAAFLLVADQYKLNPLTKEIHAFSGRGGGIVPIVGVDGWYTLANRHPEMDGFEQEEVEHPTRGLGIRTTIWRKDRGHPTRKTEWLEECQRATEPWKMKMRMLGHKSFIQTARAAFGFAGIYDEDEADRIIEAQERGSVLDVSAQNLGELTDKLADDNARGLDAPSFERGAMPPLPPARTAEFVPAAQTRTTPPPPDDPFGEESERDEH